MLRSLRRLLTLRHVVWELVAGFALACAPFSLAGFFKRDWCIHVPPLQVPREGDGRGIFEFGADPSLRRAGRGDSGRAERPACGALVDFFGHHHEPIVELVYAAGVPPTAGPFRLTV